MRYFPFWHGVSFALLVFLRSHLSFSSSLSYQSSSSNTRAMEWLNCAPFHNNNWSYCVCCYAGNSSSSWRGGNCVTLEKSIFYYFYILVSYSRFPQILDFLAHRECFYVSFVNFFTCSRLLPPWSLPDSSYLFARRPFLRLESDWADRTHRHGAGNCDN